MATMNFVSEIENILERMLKNYVSYESEVQILKMRNLLRHNESGEELTITDYVDDENNACSCCGGNQIEFIVRLKETKLCKVIQNIDEDEHRLWFNEVDEKLWSILHNDEKSLKVLKSLVFKELLEKTTLKE